MKKTRSEKAAEYVCKHLFDDASDLEKMLWAKVTGPIEGLIPEGTKVPIGNVVEAFVLTPEIEISEH